MVYLTTNYRAGPGLCYPSNIMSRVRVQRPRAPKAASRRAIAPLPSRATVLRRLRAVKPDLAARYHVRSLGLFGSYGRGTPRRRSDIDILVSFSETPSLFSFVRLKSELESSLGHRVDLVMREALRPSIGRRILAEVREA